MQNGPFINFLPKQCKNPYVKLPESGARCFWVNVSNRLMDVGGQTITHIQRWFQKKGAFVQAYHMIMPSPQTKISTLP